MTEIKFEDKCLFLKNQLSEFFFLNTYGIVRTNNAGIPIAGKKSSIDKIWSILTDLELLDKTDPTVKKATLISENKTGLEAKRKVLMQDGKNWFDEKIIAFIPNEELVYQLTDCSFPIKGLKHTYSFQKIGDQTKVQQVMEYTVKFGILGVLMDKMMIGKQFNSGINKFLTGLKTYAEK